MSNETSEKSSFEVFMLEHQIEISQHSSFALSLKTSGKETHIEVSVNDSY